MRHATSLLYHVCAVASRNIRFASCGTSGKLTLWTRYVYPCATPQSEQRLKQQNVFTGIHIPGKVQSGGITDQASGYWNCPIQSL
jgi:hypothetical protein